MHTAITEKGLNATATFTSSPKKPGWAKEKNCFGRCSAEGSGCEAIPSGCWRSNAASLHEIKKRLNNFINTQKYD
jgi:hypothetical protein